MSRSTSIAGRVDAIVVGASAGGVEALAVLLPALPRSSTVAVLIVQHLPRDSTSLLSSLYERTCQKPVREAQDKEHVEPGSVYFAPPDYHLLVDEGPQLALSADEPVHFSRPSIDVLFESAANVYAERLLGIILTGANDDGSAGLEAVHRAGGMTIVQRPDTAKAPAMTIAALKRVPEALSLTLEQIADVLSTLGPAPESTGLDAKGR